MKIFNAILALLFVVFAWFQHNDIDPATYHKASSLDALLWLLFYLLIAVLFTLTVFGKKIPKWVFIISIIACLVEMITTGPGLWENFFGEKDFTMMQTSMSAEDPRVELSREFFGALIALCAVGFLWWQHGCCSGGKKTGSTNQ